jgi:hypothetical protein
MSKIEQLDYILLDSLKHFQLVNIFFESETWSITFTFTFGSNPDTDDIVIKLSEIVQFVWSKKPDDNDGCYLVYEVSLTEINDGGAEILSRLGYPIFSRDGNILSYPSKQLFDFYLEGDINLEVVCGVYQIFQTKK